MVVNDSIFFDIRIILFMARSVSFITEIRFVGSTVECCCKKGLYYQLFVYNLVKITNHEDCHLSILLLLQNLEQSIETSEVCLMPRFYVKPYLAS